VGFALEGRRSMESGQEWQQALVHRPPHP